MFDFDIKGIGIEFLTTKLLPAIALLIVGLFIIKFIIKLVKKGLEKTSRIDNMLNKFIINALRIVLWVFIILEVLSLLGIDATSLLTVFAACGAAVALALQGSLSNLASGIIIMLTKPFAYGEYIESCGVEGTVESIDLLYTTIITADGKTVTLPNSGLTGSTLVNFSRRGTRRVEIRVGVSYNSDLELAKKVIVEKAKQDNRYLKELPITCDVMDHADSAIVLVFRGWVNEKDYWPTFFETNNVLKKTLDEAGIEIPFPQLDIHTK